MPEDFNEEVEPTVEPENTGETIDEQADQQGETDDEQANQQGETDDEQTKQEESEAQESVDEQAAQQGETIDNQESIGEPTPGVGTPIDAVTTATKLIKMLPQIKIYIIIGVVAIILLAFIALFSNQKYYEYIAPKCTKMTVSYANDDEDDEPISMDVDEFIISMIYSITRNMEKPEYNLYNALNITIRTNIQGGTSGYCKYIINNDDPNELFDFVQISSDSDEYKKIEDEIFATNQVVMTKDGKYIRAQYDAFCYDDIVGNNYILAQKGLEIPVSWAENHVNNEQYLNCPCNQNIGDDICWEEETDYGPDGQESTTYYYLDGGHGEGLSVYGAFYLASVENYDYFSILELFFGDDIEYSSNNEKYNYSSTGINGINGYGYIAPKCDTFDITDNNGNVLYSDVDMEEYLVGVLFKEFRQAGEYTETYKALVVAAASYAQVRASSDCKIKGTTQDQDYATPEYRAAKGSDALNNTLEAAVKEVLGIVIVKSGSIMFTEYDNFKPATNDGTYYIMSQGEYGAGGQKIPMDWATAHSNEIGSHSGHGRGMSQWGCYYLASEEGYTWKEILYYYYGRDIQFMSIYASSGGASIDGDNYTSSSPGYVPPYYSSGTTANGQLSYEPYPLNALSYWYARGISSANPANFTVMYDKATGYYLGAWPNDTTLSDYQGSFITYGAGRLMFPTTGVGGNTYNHNGLDITTRLGEPIYAPASGTARYSTWGHTVDRMHYETAYGVSILLDQPFQVTGSWNKGSFKGTKTVTTIYLTHMVGIRYRSDTGFTVAQGTLLGWAGTANLGGAWAPHLHITFYTADGMALYTPDMKSYFDLSGNGTKEAGS